MSEEECQKVLPHIGSHQYKFLDKALVGLDGLNEEERACKIREVEDTRAILRLSPIMATCLVYGIIFQQPSTLFTKQGLTMNRFISPSFQVPAASLQSLITSSIVVFVILYDCILVPVTRAITGISAGMTMLQRIGTGIFIQFLAMVVAAMVETKRLGTAQNHGLVDKPDATVPLSVIWLVPQYVLIGLSESLTMVGLQEFFYDQAPIELKSTGLALYLCIFGVGGFLSSFLISVIEKATGGHGHHSWFSDNLNEAHLDYFYWLLSGLSAAAFAAFLYVSKSYIYNRAQDNRQEPRRKGVEDEIISASRGRSSLS